MILRHFIMPYTSFYFICSFIFFFYFCSTILSSISFSLSLLRYLILFLHLSCQTYRYYFHSLSLFPFIVNNCPCFWLNSAYCTQKKQECIKEKKREKKRTNKKKNRRAYTTTTKKWHFLPCHGLLTNSFCTNCWWNDKTVEGRKD